MTPDARRLQEPLFTPAFAGVWAYAFVTFFSAFQLLPAIPFRLLDLGASTAKAGWFLSVYTYASAFSAPLMGSLADHIGRRRLLIVASIVFICFSIAYGLITDFRLLLVIGAIHGATWSGLIAAASAIMSDYIPPSRRNQGLAWWGLASTAAVAIAPAVGLWVFHFGWLILCIELAVLSACMTFGALMLRSSESRRENSKLVFSDAWDWRVIRTTLSITVATFGYGGVTSYTAIIAMQRHVSPRAIYLTTFASAIILFRLFFSHLGDRFGTKRVLLPSLVLIPIAFAVLAIANQRATMIAPRFCSASDSARRIPHWRLSSWSIPIPIAARAHSGASSGRSTRASAPARWSSERSAATSDFATRSSPRRRSAAFRFRSFSGRRAA